MYVKMIAQLQSIGDPSGIVPSLTNKISEVKSKLASELPLAEQLAAASDAHTQALNTLTKRTAQTALAQRFFQEAQQRQALAEAELSSAKAALDALNSALSKEASTKQAPLPPTMDVPSLIAKCVSQAQLPAQDMQAVYAFLQHTSQVVGTGPAPSPPVTCGVTQQAPPNSGPTVPQGPPSTIPMAVGHVHMPPPYQPVGTVMAAMAGAAPVVGHGTFVGPTFDMSNMHGMQFQFNPAAAEWSPEAQQMALAQILQQSPHNQDSPRAPFR